MKTKANKTESKKTAKPTTTRKESKCAFIDDLLEKLATCRCRPSHMRKAGRKPQWITEEAPAK